MDKTGIWKSDRNSLNNPKISVSLSHIKNITMDLNTQGKRLRTENTILKDVHIGDRRYTTLKTKSGKFAGTTMEKGETVTAIHPQSNPVTLFDLI